MLPRETSDASRAQGALERRILAYLAAHPDAKDTVDGIRQWWLRPMPDGLRSSDVTRALDELVRRGWLTVSERGRRTIVYGVEKSRLDELRAFIEG